jgi:hypothetical protein
MEKELAADQTMPDSLKERKKMALGRIESKYVSVSSIPTDRPVLYW